MFGIYFRQFAPGFGRSFFRQIDFDTVFQP